MEDTRYYKVYLKNKWKNNFVIKNHFPLDVVLEVSPINSHCKDYVGIKNKTNLRFYASKSKDNAFVAIMFKCREDKHIRLLEILGIEEFTVSYKIIDK